MKPSSLLNFKGRLTLTMFVIAHRNSYPNQPGSPFRALVRQRGYLRRKVLSLSKQKLRHGGLEHSGLQIREPEEVAGRFNTIWNKPLTAITCGGRRVQKDNSNAAFIVRGIKFKGLAMRDLVKSSRMVRELGVHESFILKFMNYSRLCSRINRQLVREYKKSFYEIEF